jgi:hypothetical protein
VAGNIRIDKLRAICLLEADFNWWLKVMFAKRMTHRMKKTGVLPLEQGATAVKSALDSSMTKNSLLIKRIFFTPLVLSLALMRRTVMIQ